MEREVAALQSGDEVAIGAVRSKSGSIRTWRSSARAGAGRRRAARGGVARADARSHWTDAAHHVDLAHDARLCAAPARLRVTDGPMAPLTLVRTHPRLRVGGGLRPRRSLGRAHAPDVDAAFGLALRPFFITFEGCFRAEGGAPGINPPSACRRCRSAGGNSPGCDSSRGFRDTSHWEHRRADQASVHYATAG
jgi:hypothetical protein